MAIPTPTQQVITIPRPPVPRPQPVVPAPMVPAPVVPRPQTIVPAPIVPAPIVPTPAVPRPQPIIPAPFVPAPAIPTPGGARPTEQLTTSPQPRTVTTTPQGGGIVRQFGGRLTTVTAGPAAVAGPTVTIIAETGERILTRLMDIWNGTPEQIQQLITLRYINGAPIIDVRRRDIIIEIVGMLKNQTFEEILDFLTDAPGPEFILWDQTALDEGRTKVAREIAIQQTEDVGVKGVGKCKYCPSTELVFAQKQTRSGDEAMTVFVRCVMCQKQWRQ